MSRLISRRPLIGIVAGALFGALGVLLSGMEHAPAGSTGLAAILFKALAGFLFFVAAASLLAAGHAIVRSVRDRHRAGS